MADQPFADAPLTADQAKAAAFTDAPLTPPASQVDPNTIGTLIRHWWEGGANPVQIGQLLPFPKALGGSGTDNPLLPTNIVQQMHTVKQQADAAWEKGDKVTAAAKYVESVIPILGPWMSHQGDQIQQGKYAAAAGDTAGMATGILEGKAGDAALANAYPLASHPMATDTAAQATALQRQAEGQVADRVLAPGNLRYRGRAQAIAGDLLQRGAQGDRDALRQWAQDGLERSGQQIDDAMGQAGQVPLKPYVDAVNQKIEALRVQGQDLPLEAARLAKLRELRDHLIGLGPQGPGQGVPASAAVDYADLVKLRDSAYNTADRAGAYTRAGNPDLGPIGDAAKDYGSAVRDTSLQLKPEFNAPNADYHFYKTLDDVLNPALGRPKNLTPNQTGVTGGAATQAAVIAAALPGWGGKAAASIRMVASLLKQVQSSPAWQLADATKKMQLADALRNGRTAQAQAVLIQMLQQVPRGAAVGATVGATSPLPAGTTP